MNRPWRGRPYRRGGRGASRDSRTWQRPHVVTVTPDPPFGSLIKSIAVADLDVAPCEGSEFVITDNELIASFNWVDSPEPTILVPGGPPRWTPLAKAVRLGQDKGAYFRDVNAAHFPQYPMEPAILAALSGDGGGGGHLALAGIDIVACSNTMNSLFRFIRGDAVHPRERKPFRMVVERSDGGTVFFVRRENSPRELIPNVRGFGHTFPEAYTTWDADMKQSVSHQRLVRYRFGGLGFLVRFEADGYIRQEKATATASSDAADMNDMNNKDNMKNIKNMNNIDSIDTILAGTRITSGSTLSTFADGQQPGGRKEPGALRVQIGGTLQPQDTVFDLKTRSIHVKQKDDLLAKELPRLWITQIPTLILAYHTDGLFEDVEVHNVRDKIQEWEAAQTDALQKLAALIHLILSELDKTPSRRLEIYCKDVVGHLDLRQPGPGVTDALSAGTQKLWADRNQAPLSGPDNASSEKDAKDEKDEKDEKYQDGEEEVDLSWNDTEEDFTACSSACGYCGRCTY
ncbi:hypothetical protein SBRCBS47491_002398 [Sporothrix bragantina]|uniref:Geranylgeranyl pyrophosphate synthetase n=1 Tax=Sporothrix bragantina TaxID=671064 RepID=A0ABP0B6H1_9PEZI